MRPATLVDAAEIAVLFTASRATLTFLLQLHTADEDAAFIRGLIRDATVIVAESDGEIWGFVAVQGDEIEHLYVRPDRFRRGVGAVMLTALLERAVRPIELWCFQANEVARRFYEKHGFIVIKTTDGSHNEERLPDIRYRWAPTPE